MSIVLVVLYASISGLIATATVQRQGEEGRPPVPIAWLQVWLVWPLLALGYGVALLCTREIDEIWKPGV